MSSELNIVEICTDRNISKLISEMEQIPFMYENTESRFGKFNRIFIFTIKLPSHLRIIFNFLINLKFILKILTENLYVLDMVFVTHDVVFAIEKYCRMAGNISVSEATFLFLHRKFV